MTYDLNFWPEVDWRKESSLDPRFVAVIGVCVLLLGIAAFWSVRYAAAISQRSELASLKVANERLAVKSANVTRQQECINYWKELEAALNQKKGMRMPLSRQLAAFAAVLPDTIILHAISFRSQTSSFDFSEIAPPKRAVAGAAPKAPARMKMEPFLQYECVINGIAKGGNAEEDLTRLSRQLSETREIAPWVDSVELTRLEGSEQTASTTGEALETAKTFTLVLKYKPVDWYDESSTPPIK